MKKNWQELRAKYPEIHFKKYWWEFLEDEFEHKLKLYFEYDIPGLSSFKTEHEIRFTERIPRDLNAEKLKTLVFNLGMVEMISYFKATLSPKVVVECGELDEWQKKWWRKLYFKGLGELFYQNNIEIKQDELLEFESFEEISPELKKSLAKKKFFGRKSHKFADYLIPIGGGKDSILTLEILKNTLGKKSHAFIVNLKENQAIAAALSGLGDEIINDARKLDKGLARLNKLGFINGHTPFSAMLAFLTYLVAYVSGNKYVALSNESSANEGNAEIGGEKVNHQYSKSFEFEQDFREYAAKCFREPIEYFSLLRPLNELQIAQVFATLERFHPFFRSCNVGSKEEPWEWCGKCAKCLFAYTILTPFMDDERLREIFGRNLLNDRSLLSLFLDLIGQGETKPFDCVGTFEEVNWAVNRKIEKLKAEGRRLPYLLKYYQEHFELQKTSTEILGRFDKNNSLNAEQRELLLKRCVPAQAVVEYFESQPKVLILGFGREGKSTYNFIRKHLPEKFLTIADERENLAEEMPELLKDKNVEILSGKRYRAILDNLGKYDVIMKTPGISFKDINTRKLRGKIKSELELLLEFTKIMTIGVTGTKGKSTTSTLIAEIIKKNEISCLLAGNIGAPVFDCLDEIASYSVLVLEMSSHQLEFMTHSPNVAIITNIYEEHLDHYRSFNDYVEAKCNIFRFQDKDGALLYDYDSEILRGKVGEFEEDYESAGVFRGKNGRQIFRLTAKGTGAPIETGPSFEDLLGISQYSTTYGEREEGACYGRLEGNVIVADDIPLLLKSELPECLRGEMMRMDVMFAILTTMPLGVDPAIMIDILAEFKPLRHRLEFVGKFGGVKFYDNSIATIPEATEAAVRTLGDVDTLIIGGMDRGISYEEFVEFLRRSEISHIICMPKTGWDIAKKLDDPSRTVVVDTLEEAVAAAKKLTKRGKSCLLSPAAASYGFFKNFEEKGDLFQGLVKG